MNPIFTSLSPNTEKDDILLALKLLFQPQKWKEGKASQKLKEEFKKYLGTKYAFPFNSGRSALEAILEALEIKEGDEVLVQGFTCSSALNPILAKKAKPIFVDIDETLNLDSEDLKRKISPKAKAVMVQHNFGWPAKIDEISEIARKNNLFLDDEDKSSSSPLVGTWVIEDCAHSLGAKYKGKFCGTLGTVSFFSFGRDKIISSIFGGMAVTNDQKIAQKIKEFEEKLSYPSNFWIFQQLLHPILTNYLIIPAYGLSAILGRLFLGAFHKLSILSKAVYSKEKKGESCPYFPKKFPNALAVLALNQFKKLERFNEKRIKIAKIYEKSLKSKKFELPLLRKKENIRPIFMRYPLLTKLDTDKVLSKAKKRKIFLNDGWRKKTIMPPDTNQEKMQYVPGSCPQAERAAEEIINLPTHINISPKQAKKIISFLKSV